MAKKLKTATVKHGRLCTCERCSPTYVEPALPGLTYTSLYDIVTVEDIEKVYKDWYVNVTTTDINGRNARSNRHLLFEYVKSYEYWTDPSIVAENEERRERFKTDLRLHPELEDKDE